MYLIFRTACAEVCTRTNTLCAAVPDRPPRVARLALGSAVYWATGAGTRKAILACANVTYFSMCARA